MNKTENKYLSHPYITFSGKLSIPLFLLYASLNTAHNIIQVHSMLQILSRKAILAMIEYVYIYIYKTGQKVRKHVS